MSEHTEYAIDFEWSCDTAGYELLPPSEESTAEPLPIGIVIPGAAGETVETEGTVWGSFSSKPLRVVPCGGRQKRYRPLENDRLYAVFANVHGPEDVLDFINKFGPLSAAGSDPKWGEPVAKVLEEAENFRAYLSYAAGQKQEQDLARWLCQLDVLLIEGPASRSFQLQLRPPDLMAALWLQLAEKLSGGGPLRKCPFCHTWFQAGSGARRRVDAKFCSPDCQVDFNSRKRSKGKSHA